MLPIKKLYIDSKARTVDSKSTTNFAVDLMESLPMPEDARFIVADVMIPHTWYLLSPNQGRDLTFAEIANSSPNNPNIQFITISLPPGSYNGPELESAIQLALNTYNDFPHAQDRYYNYTVQWNPVTEVISILPDSRATGVVGGITNGFKSLTAKDKNTQSSSTFWNLQ